MGGGATGALAIGGGADGVEVGREIAGANGGAETAAADFTGGIGVECVGAACAAAACVGAGVGAWEGGAGRVAGGVTGIRAMGGGAET